VIRKVRRGVRGSAPRAGAEMQAPLTLRRLLGRHTLLSGRTRDTTSVPPPDLRQTSPPRGSRSGLPARSRSEMIAQPLRPGGR